MNLVILAGRLGKAPEVSYTQGGTAKCKFSLATSTKYKDRTTGEAREDVQWHNVVVWGKHGEMCGKYLDKGSYVVVRGSMQTRCWEDERTAEKRYMTEIKADNVEFGPGQAQRNHGDGEDQGRGKGWQREQASNSKQYSNAGQNDQGDFFNGDDDIPF